MFRIDQAVDAAFDIRLSLFQLQAAHMQLFSADGKNTADGHEQNFVLIKAFHILHAAKRKCFPLFQQKAVHLFVHLPHAKNLHTMVYTPII